MLGAIIIFFLPSFDKRSKKQLSENVISVFDKTIQSGKSLLFKYAFIPSEAPCI